MKILCDKDEFALLVRECANNSMNVTNGKVCDGCLFCGICDTSIGEHFGIMTVIEDICEIVTGG